MTVTVAVGLAVEGSAFASPDAVLASVVPLGALLRHLHGALCVFPHGASSNGERSHIHGEST